MMPRAKLWRSIIGVCLLAATVIVCAALAANLANGAEDGETAPSKDNNRPDRRLKIMREAIDGFRITSTQIDSDRAPKFSPRPLLRYNDGTRGFKGLLDATAWRLGESGRPKAIVTLEIYPVDRDKTILQYEFVSLTSDKFELQSPRGIRWLPGGAEFSLAEFEEAAQPGATLRARLLQMRELARRFAAQEILPSGERIELRLLSQPIDRYGDLAADILDGAVFVFANGTNPEVGLLLECSEKQWSYGLFRLSAAKLLAQLDARSILESATPASRTAKDPYAATAVAIALPEEDDVEE
jgi:hypothetical protein